MRSIALFSCVALIAVACSAVNQAVPTAPSATSPAGGYPGWPPNVSSDLIPIPVSTELVVGPNRMLVNLITQQNEPLGSADRPVQFKLYNLAADPATAKVDTQATFLPTIQGRPGLYRADVTFDAAGDWGL